MVLLPVPPANDVNAIVRVPTTSGAGRAPTPAGVAWYIAVAGAAAFIRERSVTAAL